MLFVNRTGYVVLGLTEDGDEIRPYRPPTERRTVAMLDTPAAEPLPPSAVVLGWRPYDPKRPAKVAESRPAEPLPPGYRPY